MKINRQIIIRIPKGITIEHTYPDPFLIIKGESRIETVPLSATLTIKIKKPYLIITVLPLHAHENLLNTLHTLIKNAFEGVMIGFKKKLKIEGTGYKVTKGNNEFIFHLGYSNPIHYTIPEDIKIDLINPNLIEIKGTSKQSVNQAALKIKNLKPKTPYHLKGIYEDKETKNLKLKAIKSKSK